MPSSSAPPERLQLVRVEKSFGRVRRSPALRRIDLEVAASEIVAIVGASGCGKSTLLRIIAGLERQDGGEVLLGEQPLRGPGPDRGVVFQDHRLLPWLNVAENVGFGLDHLAPAERAAVVSNLLDLVRLSPFAHAYPHQLSGGMAQRAALARALAPEPSVLLLDEPFAALDAFTKVQLQEELLRIARTRRTTCLLVTHDIEEAVFLSERVVVMTERPGTIAHVFEVELPHPRERTSPEFSELRRRILLEFKRQAPNAAATRSSLSLATEPPAPTTDPPLGERA